MKGEEKDHNAIDPNSGMASIVERNIKALLDRRRQEDIKKSKDEHIADIITGFTGSMAFVYFHLVFFGLWIAWNLRWFGIKPFDPSFVILAILASVEAIFLSTFVLITQNRMNTLADKRADLDVQISLLTEHEVTRLLKLVKEIAKKMDIQEADDSEIDELAQDIIPEKMMDIMEEQQKEIERLGDK
jgi:uncharacterized membrane protein